MSVIFWDFDGTLVHSTHLWSTSVYEALLSVDPNTPMTFEQVRICNRTGFTWQTPDQDYRHLVGENWWNHMNRHFYNSYLAYGVDSKIALKASLRVREYIKQIDKYHLYPDTVSTLRALKQHGYHNVLLSNNYPDLQDVINQLGLNALLDDVIISALEGYDKPRKELFAIAKQRYPSDQYYMIGDNDEADIDGGNAADMITVLVHNGICCRADYSFDTLSKCLAIFGVD